MSYRGQEEIGLFPATSASGAAPAHVHTDGTGPAFGWLDPTIEGKGLEAG